jgi:predicted ArsR family transcriptional regulator
VRVRGSASSSELAGELGWTREQVRARLRPLVDEGLVRRTGHGRATRYHA